MKLLIKSIPLFTILSFFIGSTAYGQDMINLGGLSISDQTPEVGKNIKIQLLSQPTKETKPVYYFGVADKTYGYDLNLTEDLTETIFIPDSVDVVAFHVPNNSSNNANTKEEAYLFNTYLGNDIKPGSRIARTYFELQNESLFNLKISRSNFYQAIKNDYLSKNSEFEHSLSQLLAMSINNNDVEFTALIEDQVLAEKNIKDLSNLEEYYFYNDKLEKANFVQQIMTETFPSAEETLNTKVRFLQTKNDKRSFEVTLESLEQNYDTATNDLFNNTVSSYYKKNRQYDEYMLYQNKVQNPISKANNFNSLAWKISTSGGGAISFAEQISQQSIELLTNELATKSYKYPQMSVSNYEDLINNFLRKYNETYALTKYLQNDLSSATKHQRIAVADYAQVHYNETYFFYLKQANNHQNIADEGEIMLMNGEMTADMLEIFEESYQKIYPNRSDLDDKIIAFEQHAKEKLKGDLKDVLINKRPPEFVLNDINGNEISLSDYSGKVVILDFWATWCGPCKQSFPVMQDLVNEFKGDDSVAFLFINTFEGSSATTVQNFMDKSKYTFPVALDQKIGNRYNATSLFGIDGIPTKIYIGKDGNVKYLASGYGGPNKTKLETEVLIELLKEES